MAAHGKRGGVGLRGNALRLSTIGDFIFLVFGRHGEVTNVSEDSRTQDPQPWRALQRAPTNVERSI